MMARRLLIVAVALSVACAKDGPEPTHRGTYVGGYGGQQLNAFTPCGDTAMLWVVADTVTFEKLRKAHAAMTKSVFQPVYLEIRGDTVSKDEGQYLDPMYTGVLRVDTVLTLSGRAPMQCAPKFKPFDPSDIG